MSAGSRASPNHEHISIFPPSSFKERLLYRTDRDTNREVRADDPLKIGYAPSSLLLFDRLELPLQTDFY